MNLGQLEQALDAIGIDKKYLRFRDVEREAYDVFVITPLSDGRWETYYDQARGKDRRRVFQSEAEASTFFLGWISGMASSLQKRR